MGADGLANAAVIQFMLLGLPRSGTTWAANWLMTNGVICYHEPLRYMTLGEIDGGVSCNGIWLLDSFDQIDCPRVILERDPNEVNQSLQAIGMPTMPAWSIDRFMSLKGPRFHYTNLFTNPRAIWSELRADPFDHRRHERLCEMKIEPHMGKWHA